MFTVTVTNQLLIIAFKNIDIVEQETRKIQHYKMWVFTPLAKDNNARMLQWEVCINMWTAFGFIRT
jgi:hypothetical protein